MNTRAEHVAPDWSDFGPNAWLVEELHRQYSEDPASVDPEWRNFFARVADGTAAPAPRPARPQQGRPAPGTAPTPAAARPPTPRAAPTTGGGNGHDTATATEAPERPRDEAPDDDEGLVPLRSVAATIARRMEESLSVPTATSMRQVPAKLLEVNRTILNNHLGRTRGGKVSFTHLIGYAVVRAVQRMPGMNVTYSERDGKPFAVRHEHVNLGLAIDVRARDGSRVLVVPTVKAADTLDFRAFVETYETLVRKALDGKLQPGDFAGTTVTLTNPGMLGTERSIPRLMAGQAAIIGVGSIAYPAEFEGADPRTLAEIGVGKVLTLTSTYDHRVIQGAESGEFLSVMHDLLVGEHGFYDDVFESMGVPSVSVRWRRDVKPPDDSFDAEEKRGRVLQLINMYRVRGHLIAPLDPLQEHIVPMHPELEPATYGFTIWDLDRVFPTGDFAGRKTATLGEILGILRDAYCRTATVEYMHIQEPDQKRWIQERVEGVPRQITDDDRRQILEKLNQAEVFERFLHRTYLGHKRFSLEGAESLIPMLDALLDRAADADLAEVVIGMAHRGRLNVLANTIGKSYGQIFREFEGDIDPTMPQGSGDVKYHIGAAGVHHARSGRDVVVTVSSNPSHLESVNPVVEGVVRAKQDQLNQGERFPVLPVLIHGDAAFAGQGVVQETLNMSQLRGYRTGGTVHIIVNNQLGYTTGPQYARSSTYATDVARMIQAPIFHVNGDDPEACVHVARLAFAFRQAFKKDVVIDMWCYRRWGHNETDDPALTQPLMYAKIEAHGSVRERYTEALVRRGDLTRDDATSVLEEFRASLQRAFDDTKAEAKPPAIEWKRPVAIRDLASVETAVRRSQLEAVVHALTTVPEEMRPHRLVQTLLRRRREALEKDSVEWALAELLAFGTIMLDGSNVRVAGQDTRRGTFSQRHAVLVDQESGDEFVPLQTLDAPGRFFIYDSLLSEFAALGFEYGYSVGDPGALVCWEAQFGDFVNGAQVIVDAYISAAEDKWAQSSSLVLLLPHGYEGQGPEHSSARLERFLQLGAEDNMQVVVPSTPAQYFHVLRRQTRRDIRKPLIVMTHKAAMRDPAMRSPARAFTEGRFFEVLDDPAAPAEVQRLVLCAGKVFYDLQRAREERGVEGVAIARVEQLYPFPAAALRALVERYDTAEVVWVQEEPENMGGANHVLLAARRLLGIDLRVVAREESASPATGSLKVHQHEHALLLDEAFAGLK